MSKFSNLKVDRGTLEINEKASVYLGSSQTDLLNGVWTKVNLDTEIYDTNSRFADGKFTVVIPGYYLAIGSVALSSLVADRRYLAAIYVNGGAAVQTSETIGGDASSIIINLSRFLDLSVDDYVELYAYSGSGNNLVDVGGGAINTFLELHLLNI